MLKADLSSAAHDITGLTQFGVDISNAADVGGMMEKPLEVVSREIGVGVDTRERWRGDSLSRPAC